jgi:hypothetical protein
MTPSRPKPGEGRRRKAEDFALVRNAADPEQVRKASVVERELLDLQDDDLRAVMATADGRRFIWRTLGYCGMYRESFVPGRPAHDLFHAAGQRSVGLWINAQLFRVCPEQYLLMQSEAGNAVVEAEREAPETAGAPEPSLQD